MGTRVRHTSSFSPQLQARWREPEWDACSELQTGTGPWLLLMDAYNTAPWWQLSYIGQPKTLHPNSHHSEQERSQLKRTTKWISEQKIHLYTYIHTYTCRDRENDLIVLPPWMQNNYKIIVVHDNYICTHSVFRQTNGTHENLYSSFNKVPYLPIHLLLQ